MPRPPCLFGVPSRSPSHQQKRTPLIPGVVLPQAPVVAGTTAARIAFIARSVAVVTSATIVDPEPVAPVSATLPPCSYAVERLPIAALATPRVSVIPAVSSGILTLSPIAQGPSRRICAAITAYCDFTAGWHEKCFGHCKSSLVRTTVAERLGIKMPLTVLVPGAMLLSMTGETKEILWDRGGGLIYDDFLNIT